MSFAEVKIYGSIVLVLKKLAGFFVLRIRQKKREIMEPVQKTGRKLQTRRDFMKYQNRMKSRLILALSILLTAGIVVSGAMAASHMEATGACTNRLHFPLQLIAPCLITRDRMQLLHESHAFRHMRI